MIAPAHLREQARAIFAGEDKAHPPCEDCGGVHARACPRIASLKTIMGPVPVAGGPDIITTVQREVQYWPPGQWEKDVIFWDDINDDQP